MIFLGKLELFHPAHLAGSGGGKVSLVGAGGDDLDVGRVVLHDPGANPLKVSGQKGHDIQGSLGKRGKFLRTHEKIQNSNGEVY